MFTLSTMLYTRVAMHMDTGFIESYCITGKSNL